MKPIIFICNRLIKLCGHTSKMFGYLFHFIFPNKRFTIPKNSKAIIRTKNKGIIPKILWQTNFTNKVTLPVYLNYSFNRLLSPTYEYKFMGDIEIKDFVKCNFSQQIYKSFNKLNIGAAQADFWRLLVLYKLGGIYLDIDAHLVWPLELIVQSKSKELFMVSKKNHFTNHFFAASKQNPIFKKAIDLIVKNIESEKKCDTIYDLTGPTILNQVIEDKKVNFRLSKYTCVQGSFTNEHFQYIDKSEGKWTHVKSENLLKIQ